MEFQWYPGHMTKAIRQMQEDIKIIDLVIELIDARIPYASRNPDIDKLAQNKARLVLLNKRDLSDDMITEEWLSYFAANHIKAVAIDARDKKSIRQIDAAVDEVGDLAEFLMSSRGRFISGADFLIDGGTTASYWYGDLQYLKQTH